MRESFGGLQGGFGRMNVNARFFNGQTINHVRSWTRSGGY